MAPVEREAAIARGLEAYARGDWYLAHEELEPAWMGTADPGDRELLGGLIKLSAAFVHAARGNPAGVRTNLDGARIRLAGAEAAGADRGLDLPEILAAVDRCLDAVGRLPAPRAGARVGGQPYADPPHEVAGPGGRARGAPLDLAPPTLAPRSTAR